jgi:hypothetical protein
MSLFGKKTSKKAKEQALAEIRAAEEQITTRDWGDAGGVGVGETVTNPLAKPKRKSTTTTTTAKRSKKKKGSTKTQPNQTDPFAGFSNTIRPQRTPGQAPPQQLPPDFEPTPYAEPDMPPYQTKKRLFELRLDIIKIITEKDTPVGKRFYNMLVNGNPKIDGCEWGLKKWWLDKFISSETEDVELRSIYTKLYSVIFENMADYLELRNVKNFKNNKALELHILSKHDRLDPNYNNNNFYGMRTNSTHVYDIAGDVETQKDAVSYNPIDQPHPIPGSQQGIASTSSQQGIASTSSQQSIASTGSQQSIASTGSQQSIASTGSQAPQNPNIKQIYGPTNSAPSSSGKKRTGRGKKTPTVGGVSGAASSEGLYASMHTPSSIMNEISGLPIALPHGIAPTFIQPAPGALYTRPNPQTQGQLKSDLQKKQIVYATQFSISSEDNRRERPIKKFTKQETLDNRWVDETAKMYGQKAGKLLRNIIVLKQKLVKDPTDTESDSRMLKQVQNELENKNKELQAIIDKKRSYLDYHPLSRFKLDFSHFTEKQLDAEIDELEKLRARAKEEYNINEQKPLEGSYIGKVKLLCKRGPFRDMTKLLIELSLKLYMNRVDKVNIFEGNFKVEFNRVKNVIYQLLQKLNPTQFVAWKKKTNCSENPKECFNQFFKSVLPSERYGTTSSVSEKATSDPVYGPPLTEQSEDIYGTTSTVPEQEQTLECMEGKSKIEKYCETRPDDCPPYLREICEHEVCTPSPGISQACQDMISPPTRSRSPTPLPLPKHGRLSLKQVLRPIVIEHRDNKDILHNPVLQSMITRTSHARQSPKRKSSLPTPKLFTKQSPKRNTRLPTPKLFTTNRPSNAPTLKKGSSKGIDWDALQTTLSQKKIKSKPTVNTTNRSSNAPTLKKGSSKGVDWDALQTTLSQKKKKTTKPTFKMEGLTAKDIDLDKNLEHPRVNALPPKDRFKWATARFGGTPTAARVRGKKEKPGSKKKKKKGSKKKRKGI